MSDSNKNQSKGIPRPYSSTDVPTPRRVLQKIFSPVELWVVTLLLVVTSAVTVVVFTAFTNFGYSTVPLLLSSGIAALSILVHSSEPESDSVMSVPSIKSVSRTTDYVKVSSRIVVATLISGLVAILVTASVHMVDVEINSITRLATLLSLVLGFASSYIIAYSLCSYSAIYNNSRLTLPVDISSLPEIVTFLGFVIPPILIVYTGFFYTQPAFITIPFEVSVIDTLSISASLYVLYFSLVSRL